MVDQRVVHVLTDWCTCTTTGPRGARSSPGRSSRAPDRAPRRLPPSSLAALPAPRSAREPSGAAFTARSSAPQASRVPSWHRNVELGTQDGALLLNPQRFSGLGWNKIHSGEHPGVLGRSVCRNGERLCHLRSTPLGTRLREKGHARAGSRYLGRRPERPSGAGD